LLPRYSGVRRDCEERFLFILDPGQNCSF
jgi:hypothetical protein